MQEQIKATHCVSTCSHRLKHWEGCSVWNSLFFLSQLLQNLLFMEASQAVTGPLNPVVLVIFGIIRSICEIKQKTKKTKLATIIGNICNENQVLPWIFCLCPGHISPVPQKVLNKSQWTHLGQLLDKQRTMTVHCGQFMNEERFTHMSVWLLCNH